MGIHWRIICLSLVFSWGTLIPLSRCIAEAVKIGVPSFESGTDLLLSSHPVAYVLRRAAFVPIAERGSGNRARLAATDLMQVSADFATWSFRMRPGLRFNNDTLVMVSDLVFSLERCRNLEGWQAIRTVTGRQVKIQSELREQWVDIVADVPPAERGTFPTLLRQCPIVEQSSGELFGEDLGKGSDFVGNGRFELVGFKAGRELLLQRSRSELAGREGADKLEIVAIDNPERIIAALRLGNLDAYVGKRETVAALGAPDETLVPEVCQDGYAMLKRRGLTLQCVPELNFDGLKYRFGDG